MRGNEHKLTDRRTETDTLDHNTLTIFAAPLLTAVTRAEQCNHALKRKRDRPCTLRCAAASLVQHSSSAAPRRPNDKLRMHSLGGATYAQLTPPTPTRRDKTAQFRRVGVVN